MASAKVAWSCARPICTTQHRCELLSGQALPQVVRFSSASVADGVSPTREPQQSSRLPTSGAHSWIRHCWADRCVDSSLHVRGSERPASRGRRLRDFGHTQVLRLLFFAQSGRPFRPQDARSHALRREGTVRALRREAGSSVKDSLHNLLRVCTGSAPRVQDTVLTPFSYYMLNFHNWLAKS